MNNLFFGMLFVILNLNIDFGWASIDLIPDFIGYILIAYGLNELTAGKDRFSRVRPAAIGMAVYTALLFVIRFLGISVSLLLEVYTLLSLVSFLVSVYISYSIVAGIKDLEEGLEQDIGAQSLYTAWTVFTILSFAITALSFLPELSLLCAVASLVAGIVFLVFFNRTRKLYYE